MSDASQISATPARDTMPAAVRSMADAVEKGAMGLGGLAKFGNATAMMVVCSLFVWQMFAAESRAKEDRVLFQTTLDKFSSAMEKQRIADDSRYEKLAQAQDRRADALTKSFDRGVEAMERATRSIEESSRKKP